MTFSKLDKIYAYYIFAIEIGLTRKINWNNNNKKTKLKKLLFHNYYLPLFRNFNYYSILILLVLNYIDRK